MDGRRFEVDVTIEFLLGNGLIHEFGRTKREIPWPCPTDEATESTIINERITNNGIENFTSGTGVAPRQN